MRRLIPFALTALILVHAVAAMAQTCCGWCGIPAPVAKTGQKTCYDASGAVISCSGTGQDGDIQSGVGWPVPRFTDNLDGTVTDNLTGLIWLKDANCFGVGTWTTALSDANGLSSGECGLTDGSVAGDWRLPSVNELQSLINYEYANPALSNTTGDGQWVAGDPFLGADNAYYHTSTSRLTIAQYAWMVNLNDGHIQDFSKTTTTAYYVWPVRGP